ncbi:hypothetical protein [Arthrobacter sp. JZ12]|uniref:hypothetical protein n=1 Tax=Arthrobacter sp. JZ12 TaxID=2654190 RepID=UPI002B47C59B|nr:hypothetical protein [Arthrobacter sp. JZ12]
MVQYRYGSADVLHLEDRALPTFRTKDVLVRVQAAGVDRGVWHMMTVLHTLDAWPSAYGVPGIPSRAWTWQALLWPPAQR